MRVEQQVKERPILFSGPMVTAILEERAVRRRLYVRKGENPNAPEHLAARLANGLDAAREGECWEWLRTTNGDGYGTLTVSGRAKYAHRLAFELSKGDIPDGLDVMHTCDNPRCINPDHLVLGSRSDNMKDCSRKGRARIPQPRMYGESNGAAKLTQTQVDEIRARLSAGERQQVLAVEFGVSQSHISTIKRGLRW